MKNQIYRVIAIFGMFFGLASAGVYAQTPSKVEVNIPFEFSAGKATLKPGVYSIRRMSGNLLELRNAENQAAVILNAPTTLSSTDPKAVERLVFKKYGDQYLLSQVWLTVDSGRQLFTERKAAKSERVEISLRVRR